MGVVLRSLLQIRQQKAPLPIGFVFSAISARRPRIKRKRKVLMKDFADFLSMRHRRSKKRTRGVDLET